MASAYCDAHTQHFTVLLFHAIVQIPTPGHNHYRFPGPQKLVVFAPFGDTTKQHSAITDVVMKSVQFSLIQLLILPVPPI